MRKYYDERGMGGVPFLGEISSPEKIAIDLFLSRQDARPIINSIFSKGWMWPF